MSAILLREGLVKDASDLYYLKDKRDRLLSLEKIGDKSADNMLQAIDKSKQRPLARVIFSLGIRHVGEEMAAILAREFSSLDKLASASRERLVSISTIGPKIADSVIAFFRQPENRRIIERLRKAGVRLEAEEAKPEELPLAGQEFVITGRLEDLSRQEAQEQIKALGGTTKDNVTRNTKYLVVGADPGGSKLARAKELGIEQLSEKKLMRLLEKK